ncbi:MAG: winged helix-turn-helix transcriptional regulator [Ruminococcus sp.]|nr:winged helix-turn-helix transcriptional regulator [Ruminococcus sp.]
MLFELCKESPCRFGQLKKAIPEISNVVLTSALRNLEEKNLINRVQFNEIPPHVEYSLTEHGEAMLPILQALRHICYFVLVRLRAWFSRKMV